MKLSHYGSDSTLQFCQPCECNYGIISGKESYEETVHRYWPIPQTFDVDADTVDNYL